MEGESDFVLVNFNLINSSPFDVGVVQFSGSGDNSFETVQSLILGLSPRGM